MSAMLRPMVTLFLLVGAAVAHGAKSEGLYILQANDIDPSAPSSQPNGRWYHWIGADPAVTHLETAVAVDAGAYAGRGQRIDVLRPAPLAAVQVKVSPLVW